MKKAGQVLVLYLVSLLFFSLLFNYLGLKKDFFDFGNLKMQITPIIIVTIIGGIFALKYTVSKEALKIFLILYTSLWVIRYLMIYIGNQMGEIYIGQRKFRFDLIVASYYENVSRITTPLPFILFWFINNLYDKRNKKTNDGDLVD